MNTHQKLVRISELILYMASGIILCFLTVGLLKDIFGINCYGFLGRSTSCMNPLAWYDIDKYGGEIGGLFILIFLVTLGITVSSYFRNNKMNR